MIEKFRILQEVKLRRVNTRLRGLQAARAKLSEAIEYQQEKARVVAESAGTLRDREDAVYLSIMQRVVATNEIELSKDKALCIYSGHQQLEDELELASQHCELMAKEVENARHGFHLAQRSREKFDTVSGDLVEERETRVVQTEEMEAEEMFGKGRPFFA